MPSNSHSFGVFASPLQAVVTVVAVVVALLHLVYLLSTRRRSQHLAAVVNVPVQPDAAVAALDPLPAFLGSVAAFWLQAPH